MATQMATTAAATTAAAEVRGLAADRRGRAAAVVRTLALHSKVATVGALVAVAVTLAAVRAPPTMVLGFRVVVGGGVRGLSTRTTFRARWARADRSTHSRERTEEQSMAEAP